MKPDIALLPSAPSAATEGVLLHQMEFQAGYQPKRYSLLSLGLALFVQSVPVLIAFWVWQPALVQMAPTASLAVFDIASSEVHVPDPTPPEPEQSTDPLPINQPAVVQHSSIVETSAPQPTMALPVPVSAPKKSTQTAAAQPAPLSRPAPDVPSEKPADWQSRVLGRLNAVKAYPASARARRQQGVVVIRFTLDRAGTVLDVALAQSSGFALLDREALALPKRATPLPLPPDDMKGQRIELVVPVEFHF